MAGVLFFGVNIYLFWVKGLKSEYSRKNQESGIGSQEENRQRVGVVNNLPYNSYNIPENIESRYESMKKVHAMVVALKELKRTGWVQL